MTQPPHARVFPARDMALATLNAKLRQLEDGNELQRRSWLPPTPLIVGAEGSALDLSQADGEERQPHGLPWPRWEQGERLPVPHSSVCCFEEAHL